MVVQRQCKCGSDFCKTDSDYGVNLLKRTIRDGDSESINRWTYALHCDAQTLPKTLYINVLRHTPYGYLEVGSGGNNVMYKYRIVAGTEPCLAHEGKTSQVLARHKRNESVYKRNADNQKKKTQAERRQDRRTSPIKQGKDRICPCTNADCTQNIDYHYKQCPPNEKMKAKWATILIPGRATSGSDVASRRQSFMSSDRVRVNKSTLPGKQSKRTMFQFGTDIEHDGG